MVGDGPDAPDPMMVAEQRLGGFEDTGVRQVGCDGLIVVDDARMGLDTSASDSMTLSTNFGHFLFGFRVGCAKMGSDVLAHLKDLISGDEILDDAVTLDIEVI